MIGFCLSCDKALTGNQRDWCSERCRKRYERMAEKYPEALSAIRPGSSGKRPLSELFVRDSSAFVRFPSAITVVIVVKYDDNGYGNVNRQMDSWAIKSKFRAELAKMALEWLKNNFEQWQFELTGIEVHKT